MLFSEMAECFDKIEGASSRLVMADYLAELLKKTPKEEAKKIVYLLQGKIAPNFEGKEIGFGEKLVAEAIAKATGFTRKEVDALFNKIGDMGMAAEKMVEKRQQSALAKQNLTLEKVFSNLKKMSQTEGTGSQELKKKLLAELFNSSSPREARYIARIPLGSIRLGVGDPTIMDAFAIIFTEEELKRKKFVMEVEKRLKEKNPEKRKEEIRQKAKVLLREKIEAAYNVYSDLGEIAEILKKEGIKGIEKVKIRPGTPIRPTAAERLPSAEEIIKKLGKCAVEAKYDGFRLQISKDGNEVKIFSRQSEDITEMFPEIIEAVRKQLKPKSCFVEGEALAFNEETQEYYPFQVTIQRKRKYEVEKKAKEYPLNLFLFDVMCVNEKNFMNEPFHKRREELGKILGEGNVIKLSEMKIVGNAKDLEDFFEEKISQGLEGIIAKDLNAPYIAGARKFAWIKLKRSYKGLLQDTVDLTIIGYDAGRGKRTEFGLGALLVAAYNREKDLFESAAKIGTGMSEEMLKQLEEMLSKISSKKKPARVVSEIEPDHWVEPEYVIEVRADEITRSPMHSCCKKGGKGFALRFPRMISIRPDKKAEDATTDKEIGKMFSNQKRVSLESPGQK
ncbi:MAG: ATP-dependent DNA ligase [Candidatus Diapherotrites archaeon]|nr:ATP-dependent DNA ligase [Candidatus Diapherotrites archaeon]